MILSVVAFDCCAQYLHDPYSGRQFNAQKYTNIKGSSFLREEWLTGDAISKNGIYKDLKLKLDIYEQILYVNKDDKLFQFKEEIDSFILKPNSGDTSGFMCFVKVLPAGYVKTSQFMQVLAPGHISLYKAHVAMVNELNEINAGLIKNFTSKINYYVNRGSGFELMKLNKKDIEALFRAVWPKIETFVAANGLSYRSEQDVSNIVKYINSL